jgi:DNA-binding NtrC family response regulator
MAALEAYHWPGNVRELQNICERAVVLTSAMGQTRIDTALVTPWLTGSAPVAAPGAAGGVHIEPKPLRAEIMGDRGLVDATLEEIERETIVRTLHRFGGHRQKTAAALGIGVRTLGLKLKKWKQERLVAETL